MRRLFVYYRIAAADLDTAVAAVKTLHAALRTEQPALRCEVLRRPRVDAAGLLTLMEAYTADNTGIDEPRAAQIEARAAAAMKAFVVGDRHTEIFEPTG